MLCLAVNSVLVRHQCWIEVAIRQNLQSQLQGWWGRLAFGPLSCLKTPASKPFGVSSPPDSNFVVQDKTPVNSGASTTFTRSLLGVQNCRKSLFSPIHNAADIKPLHVAPDVPSFSDPSSETPFCDVSKVFGQAAENLKNYIFTLLETKDVKDHEAMSQAAKSMFAALDCLSFDYQDLKQRAEELIDCATSLDEIEQQSIPRNDSHQKLVDYYSSKKMRLEKINCDHAKLVDNLNNNNKRREVLMEEIHSTKERLFQQESELSCFSVENGSTERELEKVSKDKVVLEEICLDVSKELELSQKINEQSQAERDAAKAAFDRARAVLRG